LARYRLTKRAEHEILKIIRYGIEAFGEIQALRYHQELEHCFELLAQRPLIGPEASQFGQGVRRHGHGRHIIFYETDEHGVLILAVVHVKSLVGLIKR
jgi:toxin ParE1/3/4